MAKKKKLTKEEAIEDFLSNIWRMSHWEYWDFFITDIPGAEEGKLYCIEQVSKTPFPNYWSKRYIRKFVAHDFETISDSERERINFLIEQATEKDIQRSIKNDLAHAEFSKLMCNMISEPGDKKYHVDMEKIVDSKYIDCVEVHGKDNNGNKIIINSKETKVIKNENSQN